MSPANMSLPPPTMSTSGAPTSLLPPPSLLLDAQPVASVRLLPTALPAQLIPSQL